MVKYMKKYRIYVFLLLFAGLLDVAGQKQVCEAAVLSEKTAVIMAASQVQEKDQGQDTAEELQTGAEDFLNIKAFHLQEIEESLADLEEESSFRFADALKSLIRGEIPLNLSTLKTLVFDALLLEWKNQKETALQVFLLVIVAALVLNFTDLMEKNGTALISFFMMLSDAGSSSDEGIYRNEPDDGCNAWQSQWLYESSGAVLFCGGRFCGEQRWRAGVLRVGDPADRSGAVGAKISSSARRAALCSVFAARPSLKG